MVQMHIDLLTYAGGLCEKTSMTGNIYVFI